MYPNSNLLRIVGYVGLQVLIPIWLGFGVGGKVFEFLLFKPQFWSIWIFLLLVFEFVTLILIVLFNHYQKFVVLWLSVLLLCFYAVSFEKFMSDQEECQCFGLISVPPLLVSVVDFVLMLSILVPFLVGTLFCRRSHSKVCIFFSALIGIGIGVLISVGLVKPNSIRIPAAVEIGQQFPWFSDIKEGIELRRGSCLVLISNSNCKKCINSEKSFLLLGTDQRKVVLDIVDYSDFENNDLLGNVPRYNTINGKRWLLNNPILVSLNDGFVQKCEPYFDHALVH